MGGPLAGCAGKCCLLAVPSQWFAELQDYNSQDAPGAGRSAPGLVQMPLAGYSRPRPGALHSEEGHGRSGKLGGRDPCKG